MQFYDIVQLIKSTNVPVEVVLSYINHPEFIELIDLLQTTDLNDDFKIAMAAIFSGYTIKIAELEARQFVDYCSACICLMLEYKIKFKSQIALDANDKLTNKSRKGELEVVKAKVDELRTHVLSLQGILITATKSDRKKRAGEHLYILSILNALGFYVPLSGSSTYSSDIIDFKFEWKMASSLYSFNSKCYKDELYCLEVLTFLLGHVTVNNFSIVVKLFDVIGPWFATLTDKSQLITSHHDPPGDLSLNRTVSHKRKKSMSTMSHVSDISLGFMNVNNSDSKFHQTYCAIMIYFFRAFKSELLQFSNKRKLFKFLLYFLATMNVDFYEVFNQFNLGHQDLILVAHLLISCQDQSAFRKIIQNEKLALSMHIITNLFHFKGYIKRNNLMVLDNTDLEPIIMIYQQYAAPHLFQVVNASNESINELQAPFFSPVASFLSAIKDYYPFAYHQPLFSLLITNNLKFYQMHLKILELHKMQFQDPKLISTLLLLILKEQESIGTALCFLELIKHVFILQPNKLQQLLIKPSPMHYCLLMHFIRRLYTYSNKKKPLFVDFLISCFEFNHIKLDWSKIKKAYTDSHLKASVPVDESILSIFNEPMTINHYISTVSVLFSNISKLSVNHLNVLFSLLLKYPCTDIVNLFYSLFEKHQKVVLRQALIHKERFQIAIILFYYKSTNVKIKQGNLTFVPLELGSMEQQSVPDYLLHLQREYNQKDVILSKPIKHNFKLFPHFIGLFFVKSKTSFVIYDDPAFLIKTLFIDLQNISFDCNLLISQCPTKLFCSTCINYTLGYLRKLKSPDTSLLIELNQLLSICFRMQKIDYKDLIKLKSNQFITPSISNTLLYSLKLYNTSLLQVKVDLIQLEQNQHSSVYYTSLLLYIYQNASIDYIPHLCTIKSDLIQHSLYTVVLLIFINLIDPNPFHMLNICHYLIKPPIHTDLEIKYLIFQIYQIHGDEFLINSCLALIDYPPDIIKQFISIVVDACKINPIDTIDHLLLHLFHKYHVQIEPLDQQRDVLTIQLFLKLIINLLMQEYNPLLLNVYFALMDQQDTLVKHFIHLMPRKYNFTLYSLVLNHPTPLGHPSDILLLFKIFLKHNSKLYLPNFISLLNNKCYDDILNDVCLASQHVFDFIKQIHHVDSLANQLPYHPNTSISHFEYSKDDLIHSFLPCCIHLKCKPHLLMKYYYDGLDAFQMRVLMLCMGFLSINHLNYINCFRFQLVNYINPRIIEQGYAYIDQLHIEHSGRHSTIHHINQTQIHLNYIDLIENHHGGIELLQVRQYLSK